MFLAIVCEVNDTENPRIPRTVQTIPIRTGKLHEEVMARIKVPFISTRGEVKRAIEKALIQLEKDTKLKTIDLPLGYT